jgi:hypothetical protein
MGKQLENLDCIFIFIYRFREYWLLPVAKTSWPKPSAKCLAYARKALARLRGTGLAGLFEQGPKASGSN